MSIEEVWIVLVDGIEETWKESETIVVAVKVIGVVNVGATVIEVAEGEELDFFARDVTLVMINGNLGPFVLSAC